MRCSSINKEKRPDQKRGQFLIISDQTACTKYIPSKIHFKITIEIMINNNNKKVHSPYLGKKPEMLQGRTPTLLHSIH